MKKFTQLSLSIILVLSLLFCFVGCGNSGDPAGSVETEPPADTVKTIFLGTYEQDGDEATAEPIEWIVLAEEGDKLLVISKYALECQMFNSVYGECSWDNCSIRTWLNTDFLNNNFMPQEMARILQLKVNPDPNLEDSNVDNGMSVENKIFLLSSTEVNKYLADETLRKCQPTKYAEDSGVMTDKDGNCSWWLRTMGHGFRAACYVGENGGVFHDGRGVDYVLYGVRPAMWVSK